MQILVTGGAGFIGSHTSVVLLEAGYQVIVADNLYNSDAGTIERVKQITGKEPLFYRIDVTDAAAVERIFREHRLDGVIHFAGLKAVGESVERPLEYYYNNTVSTMVLAGACRKYGVKRFELFGNGLRGQPGSLCRNDGLEAGDEPLRLDQGDERTDLERSGSSGAGAGGGAAALFQSRGGP